MKKIIVLSLVLVCNLTFAATVKDSISSFTFQRLAMMEDFDCDACGCSASGGSMGFSSMLNTNFVGIRYFNQSYTSRDGIFANSPGLMRTLIRFRLGQEFLLQREFRFRHWFRIIFIIAN